MLNARTQKVIKYVVPTMLSNVCFFLFTVIDGIFVGRGVGTNALGAVNLVLPFTMIVAAIFMLINLGGATIFAVRIGQGDVDGADKVFRQGMVLLIAANVVLSAVGLFCTGTVCSLLGAEGTYHQMSTDHLFWCSVFIIPSGLSMGLQPLFGQSYGAKEENDLKFYFRTGILINFVGSVAITALIVLFSRPICVLFGTDPTTLEYTLTVMPRYSWGFVVMAFNVMISAYLYSTERSAQPIAINFVRSIVANTAVILLLPRIFGADIIWSTFGIYEIVVLIVAFSLLKYSERNGTVFK